MCDRLLRDITSGSGSVPPYTIEVAHAATTKVELHYLREMWRPTGIGIDPNVHMKERNVGVIRIERSQ